jgi:predicted alpha/beta superfamily hydrolase
MRTINLFVLLLIASLASYAQNSEDIVIAKSIKISSTVFGQERTIYVSTPINYANSNKKYPVLYLLDGSEVTIGFATGLIRNLTDYEIVPEMIIVAISSENRKQDFTPTVPKDIPEDFLKRMQPGGADKFLNYIESDLFPFIEKNYRTMPYRIFAGHSDAGLCVAHAFVSHNSMFNAYIATSPSLGWDSNIVNKVAEDKIATTNLKNKQLFISIGGKEHPQSIADAHTFARTLKLKAPIELKWTFNYNENEDHYSQATIALYDGLRFIYDGWKMDYEEMALRGLDAIKIFFINQTEKYGYEIIPDGYALNYIGMDAIRFGKQEEALKIFTYNTQLHPQFPDAFSCLGDCYLNTGNKELAIVNFEKAVELASALKDDYLDRYKGQLKNAKSKNK